MDNYQESIDQDALINYANSLGLELDARSNLKTIKLRISDALKISTATEKDAVMNAERKNQTIMIHKTAGDTGSDDVQTSINGKVFIVKRGIEAVVPSFVVEVLRNAIKTEFVFIREGEPLEERQVQAYPFSVVA